MHLASAPRVLLVTNALGAGDGPMADGIPVTRAADHGEAAGLLDREPFDAVVVDVRPDVIGLETVRALRLRGCTHPILFVSAHDHGAAWERAADAGADRVINFSAAHGLDAAQIRRGRNGPMKAPRFGGLAFDPARGTIDTGDSAVALRPDEYAVLAMLAECPGIFVREDRIEARLAEHSRTRAAASAADSISRIQNKLKQAGMHGIIVAARSCRGGVRQYQVRA